VKNLNGQGESYEQLGLIGSDDVRQEACRKLDGIYGELVNEVDDETCNPWQFTFVKGKGSNYDKQLFYLNGENAEIY